MPSSSLISAPSFQPPGLPQVFVDATELGDVLMTGGFRVLQGVETPTEASWVVDDTCGQVRFARS